MAEYSKPLPVPSPDSKPYWDAARRHELHIQRCKACRAFIHYPKPMCPSCQGTSFEWVLVSGRGRVHSYTVTYKAFHPAFTPDLPYIAAIIELDEGVRLMSNVIGIAPEKMTVDMPVEVVFDDVTPEVTLPKFAPLRR